MFNYELWKDIWDKLYVIVHDIPDFRSEVHKGDKVSQDKYPCAFIIPGRIDQEPSSFKSSTWYYTFEIGLGIYGEDHQKNILEIYRLIDLVGEAILADRHLTIKDPTTLLSRALVDNTEVLTVIPNWRNKSQGLSTQWIGMVVRCRKRK